ncbi:MAG: hypothetical protein GY870_05555, partial [archaeon]|nr:hypothetical protein [archaeon]
MIAIGNKYTESKDLVLPTVEEKYLNDLKDYSIATLESLRNKYKEIHCVEVSGSRYVTPNINDPWFFRNQNGNWKGFKGYYPDSNENREIAYQHDFRINCSGDCTIGAGGKLIPGYSVA